MFDPVADVSALAEQLCRIEHKLDLIVRYLAMMDGQFPLTRLDEGHVDPLTHEPVNYYMDLFKRHVIRRTNDGTKLVPPASILNSPIQTAPKGNNNGGSEGSGNAEF